MKIFKDFKISVFEMLFWAVVFLVSSQLVAGLLQVSMTYNSQLEGVSIALSFGMGFGIAALLFIISKKLSKQDVLDLFKPIPTLSVLALSVLLYFTSLPLAEYLSQIVPTEGHPLVEQLWKLFEETFAIIFKHKFWAFITICILAPILEELLYRGFLLRGLLNNGLNPWIAIVLTSLIFGFSHLNPWQFFGAGFIGMILGFIYWRTASLWLVIFLHALNNTVAFVITLQTENMEEMIFDFNSIYLIAAVIASMIVGYFLIKYSNPERFYTHMLQSNKNFVADEEIESRSE